MNTMHLNHDVDSFLFDDLIKNDQHDVYELIRMLHHTRELASIRFARWLTSLKITQSISKDKKSFD